MGVTSSIRPIFSPARASARSADCAPGPGVFVRLPPVARSLTWTAVMPRSFTFSATSCAANMAAYGEDSSRSAFTFIPPDKQIATERGTTHRRVNSSGVWKRRKRGDQWKYGGGERDIDVGRTERGG